jgi:hypothetical protein
VVFVAQYHKGYRSSGNIKIIHRYLPREVGELVVYYLWLVLPFWEKMQFQVTGKASPSAFIWGDSQKKEHRQWTGPKRRQQSNQDVAQEEAQPSQEAAQEGAQPRQQGRQPAAPEVQEITQRPSRA